MWLIRSEQSTLAVLGLGALVGQGLLLWQGQRPPLIIEGATSPREAARWDGVLQRASQVDVNTATLAELERLPGVGPTLAQRIVEHRSLHGPFGQSEELSRVKGIGPQTVEALRPYVVVKE